MGQKVNPNILRLGFNKPWKTQFFEKKHQELPNYTFKDLELKAYLERVLEFHGILIHNYHQQFSNSTITCYISYFVTPQFLSKNQNFDGKQIILRNSNNDQKTITKNSSKKTNIINLNNSSKNHFIIKYRKNKVSLKLKNYLEKNSPKMITKSYLDNNNKIEGLFNQIFKVINLFTFNKYNLIFNLFCVNKKIKFNKLQIHSNKNLILLKRFKNTVFYKDGIELLFNVVYNKNSSNLLAKFIANQVKTIKRQNFFLKFLKKSLTILVNSDISKVSGIKIMLKGRINGVSKARHKTITIGHLPLQTISKNIDYTQTYAHNSNGTYGIKVWITEKTNKNVFTTSKNKISKTSKRKIKKT